MVDAVDLLKKDSARSLVLCLIILNIKMDMGIIINIIITMNRIGRKRKKGKGEKENKVSRALMFMEFWNRE